jgi:hypothetical protein
MRPVGIVASFAVALLAVSCVGGSMNESCAASQALDSTPPDGLGNVLKSRVFFGHQSVGVNVIDGMTEATERWHAAGFAPVESRTPEPGGPRLFHVGIGENADPAGKIRDFEGIVRGGMGAAVDIAFMKLCYADLRAGTDVRPIFELYRDTLSRLAADYPRTTFLHVTVPLERRDTGLKPWIKRLIGRPVRGYEDNAAREALNDLLRNEYAGSGKLFDLALLESAAGGTPRALCAGYTDDGGHLNETGRLIIGGKLLAFLAGFAN